MIYCLTVDNKNVDIKAYSDLFCVLFLFAAEVHIMSNRNKFKILLKFLNLFLSQKDNVTKAKGLRAQLNTAQCFTCYGIQLYSLT